MSLRNAFNVKMGQKLKRPWVYFNQWIWFALLGVLSSKSGSQNLYPTLTLTSPGGGGGGGGGGGR